MYNYQNFPLRRASLRAERMASSSTLRRQMRRQRWVTSLLLVLVCVLGFSPQAFAQTIDYTKPEIVNKTNLTPKLTGQSHVTFDFIWFNKAGSNAFFDCTSHDVWLYVDGEQVLNLSAMAAEQHPEFTCNMFNAKRAGSKWQASESNADDLRKDHHDQLLYQATFTGKQFRNGTIAISNPSYVTGRTDAMKATVDLVLEELHSGITHDVRIVGDWKIDGKTPTSTYNTYATTPCKVTIGDPDFTAPATPVIVRTGSKKASYTVSGMTSSNSHQATGSSNVSKFRYTAAAWTTQPADRNNGNEYWADGAAGASSRLLWSEISSETSSKTFDLTLSSNFKPQTIYPRVIMTSDPAYEMSVYNNIIPQSVSYNKDYAAVTLPGYVRAKNINITSNIWTRAVTLKWIVEASDTKNYNGKGKWLIFRRKGTVESTRLYLGEVSSSTYTANSEVSYTFSSSVTSGKLPEYNESYTYYVVFQPDDWNLTTNLDSEAKAPELSVSAAHTIKTTNPLKSISATNDLENTVVVEWKFDSFEDANTNAYAIEIQYREKVSAGQPENAWAELHTQNVTSASTTSGTYEHTGISSKRITYEYRAVVEALGSKYYSKIVTGKINGSSKVVSVTASRGAYAGVVRLTWSTKQVGADPTYYVVKRRSLGTSSANVSDYQEIYSTSGVVTSYSYEDVTAQPGCYYEYMVECYTTDTEGTVYPGNSVTTDGFALALGVVNGRVSYGGGTAVEGVKVSLVNNSSTDDPQAQFRSMRFGEPGSGAGVVWEADAEKVSNLLLGKSWSVQMNVYPDASKMNINEKVYTVLDSRNTATISLVYNEASKTYDVRTNLAKNEITVPTALPANEWSNITVAVDSVTGQRHVGVVYPDGTTRYWSNDYRKGGLATSSGTKIVIGNYERLNSAASFCGNIDEFRFFTRVLTEDDIKKNYDHRLSGSEDGLAIYYPMDEGLPQQAMVYDYSRTGGIANGRHATVAPNTNSSTNVPSADQFSICSYTDKNGNYSVSGIPFSGDGTSYSIIPTMGVHQFSPSEANRFVSAQSLIHNGVDFTDVSSFPVRGKVVYEGTTFPVTEATLYVDGLIAARDGAAVMTNDEGEFVVDVPIGSHFISVKKNGHTFQNEGRYPADPDGVGTRYVFEEAMNNLTFYDTTLVPVAGRVVGGDIEDAYPLGFGVSTANIGQATITLEAEGNHLLNATPAGDAATEERVFAGDIIDKVSTTTVGAADPADPTAVRTITIKTNAETGEFAAMLPPLKYNVKSISTASYTFPADNLPVIDATNPIVTNTDTLKIQERDGSETIKTFDYVASMKKRYKAQPVLDIAGNNPDGSFGDTMVAVRKDKFTGLTDSISAYTIHDGIVDYRFGAPAFQQLSEYTFGLKGYERYENLDDPAQPVVDIVPLKDVKVTFQNEFAITTGVNPDDASQVLINEEDGVVTLDENGLGQYTFKVGLPNIVAPYQRNLTATYVVDDQTYTWKDAPWTSNVVGAGKGAFNAIVLGQMPSGNDFMTAGPDKIHMILRDPAGSASSASWTEGHSHTKTWKVAYNSASENSVNTTTHLGVEVLNGTGGIGFMVIQDLESKANLEVGVDINVHVNYDETYTDVVTTTKTISTSDSPDYVGAPGDVFVGSATNIIFGDSRTVCVVPDGAGDYSLDVEDQLTMGKEYTTSFVYTQYHIENVLLPTFREQRDALLVTVATLDEGRINRPAADTTPRYETLLSPSDPHFGEPDTYIMIEPADYKSKVYEDRVNWYNLQINAWTRILADNEQAKVTAYANRDEYLKDNHSFDAGSTIQETVETFHSREWAAETLEELKISVGVETGYRFAGVGLSATIKTTESMEFGQTNGTNDGRTTIIDYTLAETGNDDYLSVDVLEAPDGFGPIFYTRGGATSCPYEDEIKTKYYNPGATISDKTVQVEQPEIAAVDFASITGVPSGKDAEMAIQLRNLSQTKTGAYYNISVVDTTNPDGLQVIMDGYNVTNGRTVYIPADDKGINKKIYFRQSNTAVTDYKDVVIRLSSVCEPSGIYSDLPVNITFQPAGSDIELAASEIVVNTYTQAPLRLSMRGYDINARALESVRLQYKGLNDAQWLTLKEYVKDGDPRLASDPNLGTLIAIEGTRTLDYELDLRDALYTDQTYVFRAQTVCTAAGSYVYGESQMLQVVRDMHRPQLMGNASPSDGVLNAGDEISIVFNEDVRSNALGKAENFSVRGVLNGSQLTHDAALQLTAGGEGAKTSSTIDLSGRSFSLGTWMRYSAAGHIFQHGDTTTGLDVSVNAADQLVVTLAGQTLTSTETLRPDTWLYLNVAYDNDAKTVSANYAYDSYSVALLRNETVSETANGSESAALVIGRGLTGSLHELTLWNSAKAWEEVLGGIYTTKDRTTRGLLGYWRFDEGHGTVAADYSRSRHMEVPATNAWYIAQTNHALVLDGTAVAQLPITESLKDTDDYMIEGWFMAATDNNAPASIIGFGQQPLDVRLNAEGRMEVATDAATTLVGTTDYRDGQWHHVALNVLRSENGRTTVYVDGEALKQVFAVPALQTATVIVGGHADPSTGTATAILKGGIDEVRIWRGTRTAETIKQSANHRVNGADEPALMMYYPFEESTIDAYQQTVIQSTLADKSKLGGTNVVNYFVGRATTSTAVAPSLKAAPNVENIPFTFVADERRIVINLDVEPARLEGNNVEITVHSVSDKNGNYCLPITWTAYVQQNQLTWADDAVELTKKAGEVVNFDAVIVNQSGNTESWTLSGLPTWLHANVDNGSLQPLAQKTIRFTVDEGVAIGSHEAVVYLTGSMDIDAPLVISLTNLGDVPEWSVNPADYEYTMNIYGQLHIDGVPTKDKNDIVAAFRGNECVGVAQPVYKSRYDAYFVLMNVYGNASDANTPLKYKVYDASTGQTFPIVIADDHRADNFVPDAVVGTMSNPYIWNTTDCIEQNLALKTGWQWISFYVDPRTPNATDLMADVEESVNIMVSENLSYTPITNSIYKVAPAVMYKLNMQQAADLDVVGKAVKMDETPVSIKSGWNWIGYPANGVISLEEAFADLDPQNDDMVKSQTGFATWDEYEWVGSLSALRGGEGYQYLSGRDASRTFHYPAYSASAATRKAPRVETVDLEMAEAASAYASNMNIIALVQHGGAPVEAQIRVVDAEGNLRGVSNASIRDDRHFVTIAGDTNGDVLKFIVTVDGFDYIVPGTLYFAPDAVIGTLKAPFVIDLSSPTGIGTICLDEAADYTYDLSGRMATNMSGVQVVISDGKKTVLKR